jgi:hypothetical protein
MNSKLKNLLKRTKLLFVTLLVVPLAVATAANPYEEYSQINLGSQIQVVSLVEVMSLEPGYTYEVYSETERVYIPHSLGEGQTGSGGTKFLVKPDHTYRIYRTSKPTSQKSFPRSQVPDFTGVDLTLEVNDFQPNPNYQAPDQDRDSVDDREDNCQIANQDQEDINQNGIGDSCEDFDRDGVLNFRDNCPDDPNANQEDRDLDGVGDACDQGESRFFEQYPWAALTVVFGSLILVVVILVFTLKDAPKVS